MTEVWQALLVANALAAQFEAHTGEPLSEHVRTLAASLHIAFDRGYGRQELAPAWLIERLAERKHEATSPVAAPQEPPDALAEAAAFALGRREKQQGEQQPAPAGPAPWDDTDDDLPF